jgi:hypothetical protein
VCSLFILFTHLLVTLARLARPGGVRAVAVESLAVKHQLLIMNRSRRRSPNLTRWDRAILGFCTLPRRLGKMAVILKTSTLLRLHRALVIRLQSYIRPRYGASSFVPRAQMEIRAPSPDQVDGLEGLVCGQVREGAGSDRFAI